MDFFITSNISENILTTPEGYLVCPGIPIARTGEMIYGPKELMGDNGKPLIEPGTDGLIRINRDAKEVFRPETMASFEGKSITIGHPKGTMVGPENWNLLSNGILQNIRRGTGEFENDLLADLLITSKFAITEVKKGLREVSCGYTADYFETGIGQGEQRNIIGNHLALVSEGRAGSSYAIVDHKGENMGHKEILEKLSKKKDGFTREELKQLQVAVNDAAMAAEAESGSSSAYDKLCGMLGDMKKSLDAMMKGSKDASTPPDVSSGKPAEIEATDAESAAPSMEERMKKCEDALTGMTTEGQKATDEDKIEMEEEEESVGDEASEEEEDEPKAKKTGDEVFEEDEELHSRAEILAPGIKKDQKNLKVKSLRLAYETEDGKEVIERFTAGKKPEFKNAKFVDAVFIGVSEILKVSRTSELAQTKKFKVVTADEGKGSRGRMTPEKLNKINAEYWNKNKTKF